MTAFGIVGPLEHTEAAIDAGVDYVEPTIAGNLVTRTDDGAWVLNPAYAGERFPSFAILFPGDLRVSDPGFPAAEVTAYLDTVLELVGSVAEPGAKIVFGSGAARRIPDGVERGAGEDRLAEVLVEARDTAARNGLRIMLEPLNTGECNVLNSIEECIAFLDRFGITDVPVVADLFHIQLEHEPLEVIRRHSARIGHAHIADAERHWVGSGDWPWREFVTTLRESGYDGAVSLECYWGDDFSSEVRASLENLRAM